MAHFKNQLAVALAFAGGYQSVSKDDRAALDAELRTMVPRVNSAIGQVTGLVPEGGLSDDFELGGWPRAVRSGRARSLAGAPWREVYRAALEIGNSAESTEAVYRHDSGRGVVTYLAPALTTMSRLYVERDGATPATARRFAVARAAGHEQTHSWQGKVAPHVMERIEHLRDVLFGHQEGPDGLTAYVPPEVESRAELWAELQNLKRLVESHAEYVGDAFVATGWSAPPPGPGPGFDAQTTRPAVYTQGMPLIHTVATTAGMPALNEIWRDLDAVPSEQEWREPKRWMRRVLGPDSVPRRGPK